jgi:DNA polymerase IV
VPRPPSPRVVVHLDMDAFYAAVEVREDPSLAGKPVVIGHRGRRGVVSTCSYEARRFGVHSAMPSVVAERLCPGAVWLPGRMALYVEVSHRIREILERHSPLVEPLSIDEAFLDLTGIARDLADGRRIAAGSSRRSASASASPARRAWRRTSSWPRSPPTSRSPTGSSSSRSRRSRRASGRSPSSASGASDRRRPSAFASRGSRPSRTSRTRPKGASRGSSAKSSAEHLLALAHGRDDRAVQPGREAKSISEERTYGDDLTRPADVDKALLARADGVARELRHQGLVARTVHLKVRTGDFETVTRSKTLSEPTDLAEVVLAAARELFRDRVF